MQVYEQVRSRTGFPCREGGMWTGGIPGGVVLVWCQPVPGCQHLHSSLDTASWCSAGSPNAYILTEPQTTEYKVLVIKI